MADIFITIRQLGNRGEASAVVLPEKGESFTLSGAGRNGAEALSDINRQACKKGLTGRSWVTSDGLRGVFAPPKRKPRAKKVIPDPLAEWGAYQG